VYGQQKNNHHTNNFPTCFIEDYINVFHLFDFFNNLIFNFENVKIKKSSSFDLFENFGNEKTCPILVFSNS